MIAPLNKFMAAFAEKSRDVNKAIADAQPLLLELLQHLEDHGVKPEHLTVSAAGLDTGSLISLSLTDDPFAGYTGLAVLEIRPGVRGIQVGYKPRSFNRDTLLKYIEEMEQDYDNALQRIQGMNLPNLSGIVEHLDNFAELSRLATDVINNISLSLGRVPDRYTVANNITATWDKDNLPLLSIELSYSKKEGFCFCMISALGKTTVSSIDDFVKHLDKTLEKLKA
jgi:hypothetical protein